MLKRGYARHNLKLAQNKCFWGSFLILKSKFCQTELIPSPSQQKMNDERIIKRTNLSKY